MQSFALVWQLSHQTTHSLHAEQEAVVAVQSLIVGVGYLQSRGRTGRKVTAVHSSSCMQLSSSPAACLQTGAIGRTGMLTGRTALPHARQIASASKTLARVWAR